MTEGLQATAEQMTDVLEGTAETVRQRTTTVKIAVRRMGEETATEERETTVAEPQERTWARWLCMV